MPRVGLRSRSHEDAKAPLRGDDKSHRQQWVKNRLRKLTQPAFRSSPGSSVASRRDCAPSARLPRRRLRLPIHFVDDEATRGTKHPIFLAGWRIQVYYGMAGFYNNLADLHVQLGNNAFAQAHYEKSQDFAFYNHHANYALATYKARRFAMEMRRPVPTLSEDAVRALETHRWPGNVRELQNMLKRAVIMAEEDRITALDLGLRVAPPAAEDTVVLDLRVARENAERQVVITALARTDGNIVRAAELLGVSRPTLYDLMNRLQIK